MSKLWLIISFSFILLIVTRQDNFCQEEFNFLPERESFNTELKKFFDKYGTAKGKDILDNFVDYTKDTELEENEWIVIAEICNNLNARQSNRYLYISGLIKSITSFSSNPDRPRNFQVWSQNVVKILQQESRRLAPLTNFFEFTQRLHDENIISGSTNIIWKISRPDYKFSIDREFFVQTGRIDITGVSGRDSSRIQATVGKYYPSSKTWVANGGKISWEKVGIDNNLVYVNIDNYSLDLSKSVYSIDSVNLNDQRNFDYPILGKFEDKLSIGIRPERSGYPRFSSYEANYRIKSIFEGMDYKGGYSLEGLKIVGSGIGKQKGELMVFKNNKPIMQLNSHRYVFDQEGAKGLNTATRIFLDQDSIVHPGLFFQFKKAKNELVLMRDGSGSSNSKFFDSYHQMTLDVGMMKWSPGDSLLYLSGVFGSLENNAVFESADFFSHRWFDEIQKIDTKNPLLLVKQCADHYNTRSYYSWELASFMKKPIHLVEEMIFNVSYLGFVRFDTETKLVEVLQRTYDFLNQHAGLLDYDIIKFNSDIEPPNPNAIINLISGRMKVLGVEEVNLSYSRSVKFNPSKKEVLVFRGRNMKFDGTVEAGLMTFRGSGFIFNYNDYELDLSTVDRINLKVHIPLVGDYQDTKIANISSIIEDTRGQLTIDAPGNKAGLEPELTPQYPLFRFDTSAFVYYDQKYIQNGAYTRDNFFFEISPNTLTGLNDVRFRENLFFPGAFQTHNIFPKLELDLVYRDDNSLGFDTFYTPEEGYPVYIDRGTFYNQISMNNSGLRGNGTLSYLGNTIESENILFLPDRAIIQVDDVVINKNSTALGNPEIIGNDLIATWFPEENTLNFDNPDKPLILYGSGEFLGQISIGPESIQAGGRLLMDEFTAISEDLTFMEEQFEMSDGQLNIHTKFNKENGNSPRNEDLDFIGRHISGTLDLKNRIADYSNSDTEGGELSFPKNKYTADGNTFNWDMDSSIIIMNQEMFTSTRTDQNSLGFSSGNSIFDLNTYTIQANEVPWIDVADVRIFPGSEEAVIRENAILDSMPDSRVISKDDNLAHEFRNALVKIRGINNYWASGDYVYKDIAEQELLIPFEEFGARSDNQSGGNAKVDTLAPFYLSPEFSFIGNIDWKNSDEFLSFKGSYSLNQDCPGHINRWVRMDTKIDPQNVSIPVDSVSRSYDGEVLRQGFFLSNQPIELYSSFLGPTINFADKPLISTSGNLVFDYTTNKYVISNSEEGDTLSPGTELSFDRNNCVTAAKGKIDLGVDLGQVGLSSTGLISHDVVKDSIEFDMIMTLDFFLDEKLLDFFAESLNNRAGLSPVDYSRDSYKNSLKDWLGEERGDELLNELSLMGGYQDFPDEFNHTLLLSDIKMKWNQERGSYQSVGKIGIGNIEDRTVNKLVNGHLEIVKRRGGDTFTFYVEFDNNAYFFFYFNRNLMQVMAGPTFEDFNNRIRKLKPKKRRLKVKTGPRYEFTLGQYRLVRNFLDAINE